MKEQDRIYTLLARKLAGEASEPELRELEQLQQLYPDLTFTIGSLTEIWNNDNTTQQEQKSTQAAFDQHLLRMKQKLKEETMPRTPIAKRVVWKKQPAKPAIYRILPAYDMLQNYCKTASRSLLRNKTFSIINILGLAIGMAGAVVLLLWIYNDISFDQFHARKERIYQVYSKASNNGKTDAWPATPNPLGPVLKHDYPQVEEAVRVNWVGAFVIKHGEKQLQSYGFLTDPAFLSVFNFPLLDGDARAALKEPHSIVVTETLARRLFGETEDVVGQVIRIDSNVNFTITGVLRDLPGNTRFRFEYLIPWSYMKEVGWESEKWGFGNIDTYVLLKPGITEARANQLFAKVIQAHDPTVNTSLFVHPLRKWNLWSQFENGKIIGGRIDYVRLFIIIAAFILLIACINYMNMSTARSERRAKEVGIRKVAGAGKGVLVAQFITESIVISLLAGVIALLIIKSALPWFNNLVGKSLTIPYTSIAFWLAAIGFILFTGILAGSYPAFYLSAFRPVKVLKGTFKATRALITPRKVLVVIQFTFAILFIICTIIIYRQIIHAQQREVGYKMNNLAFVYVKGDMRKNYPLIKSDLLASGAVTSVTRTNSPITDIWSVEDGYTWEGMKKGTNINFIKYLADDDFTQTVGIKVLQGRDINTKQYATDSTAILLTQSAAAQMQLQNPVGKWVKSGNITWHVVGVIADFIPGLPYDPFRPIVLQGPIEDRFGAITFRMTEHTEEKMNKVAEVFREYNPDYPFESYYLEDAYNQRFRNEVDTGKLAAVFAGLAIFISCLGLFALATYMAESRVKEIGVRKVLGASATAIVTLLSRGFFTLIGIAFLVAMPIAWWIMNSWLQHYSYRISISWWIFVVTGLVSLLITVLSVSYQAIRAALSNPVKALRSE